MPDNRNFLHIYTENLQAQQCRANARETLDEGPLFSLI
jgi:hypothetical protein